MVIHLMNWWTRTCLLCLAVHMAIPGTLGAPARNIFIPTTFKTGNVSHHKLLMYSDWNLRPKGHWT